LKSPTPLEETNDDKSADKEVIHDPDPPVSITMKDELEKVIQDADSPSDDTGFGTSYESYNTRYSILNQRLLFNDVMNHNVCSRLVNRELAVLESTKKRTPNLETLFQCLKTIQPTSVESERAFSSCGLFLTKLRNRLDDNIINALCFLKNSKI
jgi:hypothetical protein